MLHSSGEQTDPAFDMPVFYFSYPQKINKYATFRDKI
jgi:hypothetical protein